MVLISELDSRSGLDFSVLCKKILALDNTIQSVEIVNKKGRLVEWAQSDFISLPAKKREIFHMSAVLHESMRHENDDDFGKVNYSYVSREKVGIFSFRMDENMLIVISSKPANPDETAKGIISQMLQITSHT
jgi:hypothetical protein